jgi:hypothetical protein
MKRILLITIAVVLVLCVACMGLGYFVAVPRVKDGVEDGVNEAVATYVAPEIAGIGVAPEPGTYTLSEAQVNDRIKTGDANLQDLRLDITPAGLQMHFGEQGQDISYTAQVSAVDGKIDIQGADLTGIPTWIVPTDAISKGVEQGINTYLEENNLTVTSVTLQEGSMTLVLAGASATPVS